MKMNCAGDGSRCKSRCLTIALLAIVGIAILGAVVMLLWNALIPSLFAGTPPVGYFQALGLLLLSRILFGGFRGGCHGRWRGHPRSLEHMTPDERERLRNRFGSRWCTPANDTDDLPGGRDTRPTP